MHVCMTCVTRDAVAFGERAAEIAIRFLHCEMGELRDLPVRRQGWSAAQRTIRTAGSGEP